MKRKTQLCKKDNIDLIAAMIVAKGSNRAAADAIGIKENTLDKWLMANPEISRLVKTISKNIKQKAYTDVMQQMKTKGREDLEQWRVALFNLATGQDTYVKTTEVLVEEKGKKYWKPVKRTISKFTASLEALVVYIRLFGDEELRQYADAPMQAPVQVLQQNIELGERELREIDKEIRFKQINMLPGVEEKNE